MKKINVFCFGFGQVAKSFVKKLKIEKIPFKLTKHLEKTLRVKILEILIIKAFNLMKKNLIII